MWLAKARLVPEAELSFEDRAKMAPALLRSQREDAVVAFAMGDTSVDLSEFTDPDAQFIDIYATVRKFRAELRPEHMLGLKSDGIVIEKGECRGFGPTSISTLWLTKPATPRRPERHIVWTLVWQRTGDEWDLVGSHASAQ